MYSVKLIKTCAQSVLLTRNYQCTKLMSNFRFLRTSTLFCAKQEELLLKKRRLNEEEKVNFGELVYKSPKNLADKILPTKLASILFSCTGFGFLYKITSAGVFDITVLTGIYIVLVPVSVLTFYAGHWFTKRFVTEMYYNSTSEVYTAILLNFLGFKQTLKFRAEHMKPPLNHAMFCSIFVAGYPLSLFTDGYKSESVLEQVRSIEYAGMNEDIYEDEESTETDYKKLNDKIVSQKNDLEQDKKFQETLITDDKKKIRKVR